MIPWAPHYAHSHALNTCMLLDSTIIQYCQLANVPLDIHFSHSLPHEAMSITIYLIHSCGYFQSAPTRPEYLRDACPSGHFLDVTTFPWPQPATWLFGHRVSKRLWLRYWQLPFFEERYLLHDPIFNYISQMIWETVIFCSAPCNKSGAAFVSCRRQNAFRLMDIFRCYPPKCNIMFFFFWVAKTPLMYFCHKHDCMYTSYFGYKILPGIDSN